MEITFERLIAYATLMHVFMYLALCGLLVIADAFVKLLTRGYI